MKKKKTELWMFSFAFFIFLSSFMIVKSIFILLFNAPFSPSFILELTPFYLISSIEESQLLFFSLIIVLVDTYLHIKDTKKNLLYSFIPTFIILGSISIFIVSNDFSVQYTVYYLLFASFLAVLIIDNKRTLPEPSKRAKKRKKKTLLLPAVQFKKFPVNKRKAHVVRVRQAKPVNALTQLKEIKPAYATALEAVGIKSIEDLAGSDPKDIMKKFESKNIKPAVNQKMVEKWIESAKIFREKM
ncbi:MAG: hypothetical protein DRN33_04260 [Thermoplasmata archaeon]|nr:helix-hairpin-helix domain-containing protein [Thermoplasmata archaeon]RLF63341.1 MAG: hypothetical protein DRN33_04260 [Thermoplasmata archaeon]HDD57400.1 helix-hairpin-helix domain-containing protein [Thermoplasmatales archaeon]